MTSKCQRDKNQNIQVFVRVRPINNIEKNSKSCAVVDCPNNREVIVKERPSDRFTRTFAFDQVFGPNSRQIDVYMSVVHPMISEVLAGYNCTVFAYGQTGTGKTFTMEGERSQNIEISWDNDPLSGIIPRALSNLFDELRILQVEFSVRVSLLELYNEELIDLLSTSNDSSKIRLFEDTTKKGSVIIQGLEEILVDNKNQVYSIMEKGSVKRQTAATLMNAQSSRSHTVFSITVHIKENSLEGEELVKTGKLNLVDLAGSENIGRSGAIDKRAREAGNINQSLLTLGRVITALVEKRPHVPYRESKLTRLLQDSLGGRTKTSIIATISPASCNLEETLSTLDYAHRAKNIMNRPEINQKLTKKTVIKEYTAEIERLRRDLQATRDKNGVYIANENYTKMTVQIEQQEQEISQYLGQIKALREEMEKKEEICNQLNVSLEVCSDKLASTFAELGDTQEKLMNTVNVCNEREHLLDKHVETEEKLSQQAQSLLAVADMASSDAEKLHDKLARKRSVESENEVTIRHFHTSFVQNIAHMQDSVNGFTQDLTKSFLGLQTSFGESLEKRSVELTALSNEMSSFVDSRTQQIQDLEKIFSNQVYNGQQLIQQFLTTVHSTSDSEVNNLHTFLTETFLAPVRGMARQVQLIEAEIQSSGRTFHDQLQQQMDGMKTLETLQRDELSQLRDNTLLQFKQQRQSLEQSEEGVRALEKASSAYKEAVVSEVQQLKNLADRFLNTHGEFDSQFSDRKSKIKSGLAVAREKCDHLSQVTSMTLEQQLKRRADHLSVYERQTEELINNIGHSRQTLDQLISRTKQLGEELDAGTRLSVSNGERAWRNHYSWTEQELRKYSENLNGELQRELKQTQDLMTGLRESAESHEAILEQQRKDFGTFVRERQDDLDSECSYISSWSQSMVSQLQQRDQDLDKFLVEDLLNDIATGNTPERRGFNYPRQLAATSPHERILARYREMKDAASFKLPNEDSKLTRISSSPESLDAASDISSEIESLKDARGKSMSVNDIPDSSDTFLNASLHSEPATFKQSDSKENSQMSTMKKFHSEDLKSSKQPKRVPSSRKILGSRN